MYRYDTEPFCLPRTIRAPLEEHVLVGFRRIMVLLSGSFCVVSTASVLLVIQSDTVII